MDHPWNHDYPQIARDAGFKLKQMREGELDWRMIGAVDVDTIIRNQNLERLDTLVMHVSEAPLASILDSNVLDVAVIKYFKLAQLSVQYLIFCKKFLDETVINVRKTLHTLQVENRRLAQLNNESKDELLQLHKKIQRIEDINQVIYPCSQCPKNFISNEMLDLHIKRKHTGQQAGERTARSDNNLINTIKLELEIKHLKERLNIAEKEIRDKQGCRSEAISEIRQPKSENSSQAESPRASTTTTSSTQTDVTTRSVGIQSNLEEPKEVDDVALYQNTLQQNIIEELRGKLTLFEEWKKKEAEDSERSIELIKKKVNEMMTSLDGKLKQVHEVKSTPPIPTISRTDIQEMQTTFAENLTKICQENELKLSSAIRTFEAGYKNKLEGLELLIGKYEKSLEAAAERGRKVDEDFQSNQPIEASSFLQGNLGSSDVETDEESAEKPDVARFSVASKSPSIPYLFASSDDEADDSSEKAAIQDSSFLRPKSTTPRASLERPQTAAKSKASRELSTAKSGGSGIAKIIRRRQEKRMQNRPKSAAKSKKSSSASDKTYNDGDQPKKESVRQKAVKLFRKPFKIFSTGTKSKGVPTKPKEEKLSRLSEKRSSYRKKYPTYYASRGKLRQSLRKENRQNRRKSASSQSDETSSPRQQQVTHLPKPLEKSDSFTSSSSDSSGSVTEPSKPKPQATNPQLGQQKTTDQFKARLERILASPIRKPATLRTSTPSSTPRIEVKPATTSALKKPVPTPRKKVMFNVDSKNTEPGSSGIRQQISATDSDSDLNETGITQVAAVATRRRKSDESESSSISSLLKLKQI